MYNIKLRKVIALHQGRDLLFIVPLVTFVLIFAKCGVNAVGFIFAGLASSTAFLLCLSVFVIRFLQVRSIVAKGLIVDGRVSRTEEYSGRGACAIVEYDYSYSGRSYAGRAILPREKKWCNLDRLKVAVDPGRPEVSCLPELFSE